MSFFQTLLHGKPPVPAPAFLLLQRTPIQFNRDMVLDKVEPAFGRSLSDGHPYWYAGGQSDDRSSMLSFGGLMVSTFHAMHPEFDEDRATPTLPPVAQRAVWGPYAERIEINTVDNPKLTPQQSHGLAARVALAFLDANCTGIYDCLLQRFLPASGETLAEMQRIAAMAPVGYEGPPIGRRAGLFLLLRGPAPVDAGSMRTAVERAWQAKFPDSSFWSIDPGKRPSVMLDAKSVYLKQAVAPFAGDSDGGDGMLPPLAIRNAWGPYHARLALISTGANDDEFAIRRGAVARFALGYLSLLEGNCLAVYDAVDGVFYRSPAEARQGLQAAALHAPQMGR